MENIIDLISKLRTEIEKCRYNGCNDSEVMDAVVTLNKIDYLAINIRLNKLERQLETLQKVHGEMLKKYDVHSACVAFKFKDGAVYRVGLSKSTGHATLD